MKKMVLVGGPADGKRVDAEYVGKSYDIPGGEKTYQYERIYLSDRDGKEYSLLFFDEGESLIQKLIDGYKSS